MHLPKPWLSGDKTCKWRCRQQRTCPRHQAGTIDAELKSALMSKQRIIFRDRVERRFNEDESGVNKQCSEHRMYVALSLSIVFGGCSGTIALLYDCMYRMYRIHPSISAARLQTRHVTTLMTTMRYQSRRELLLED